MDPILFEIVFTLAAACAVGTLAANIVWRAVAAAMRWVFRGKGR